MNRTQNTPRHYLSTWRGEISIPPDVWPDTLVSTCEAATILGCSVRTLERYRTRGTGPKTEPLDAYVGRPRFYLVWRILTWRSRILGHGPETREAVWQWFIDHGLIRAAPLETSRAVLELKEKMLELDERRARLNHRD